MPPCADTSRNGPSRHKILKVTVFLKENTLQYDLDLADDDADTTVAKDVVGYEDVSPADLTDTGAEDTASDTGATIHVKNHGVTATNEDGLVTLSNGVITVRFAIETGLFSVLDLNDRMILQNAQSVVRFTMKDSEHWAEGADPAVRSFSAAVFEDSFGPGVALTVQADLAESNFPTIATTIELRANTGFVTATTTATWDKLPADPVRITHISTFSADTYTKGALFLGDDPSKFVMLDNCADVFLDMAVQVYPVGQTLSLMFTPGSASRWNVAVTDTA